MTMHSRSRLLLVLICAMFVLGAGATNAGASILIGRTAGKPLFIGQTATGDFAFQFWNEELDRQWVHVTPGKQPRYFSTDAHAGIRTSSCDNALSSYRLFVGGLVQPTGVDLSSYSRENPFLTMVCEIGNTVWYLQLWTQFSPDFGGSLADSFSVRLSSVPLNGVPTGGPAGANPAGGTLQSQYNLAPLGPQIFDGFPTLLSYLRWSKFSPGGYEGYLKQQHFPYLFGSFSYGGVGVWGPGNKFGAPTNDFGRNAYIDSWNSDYGRGWRRNVGVLTQKPNGIFCYEFSPKGGSKGKTGLSKDGIYSVTIAGPGMAPDRRVFLQGPAFAFGNDTYNPRPDKWGTNFSDQQAQALRDQVSMMGADWRRKVKGTDCALQLRQLPDSFYAAGTG